MDLRKHFTDGQVMEIMFFVGTYNMLQRSNTALGMEPLDGERLVVHSIGGYGVKTPESHET